ncbi:ABC transporter permease [Isobaculum melis]|uniref:ABC-2 type transport system permease protein n=1 Tax=Isobaculum melis TaxID=142588 RepID=A0A1H9PQB5_9LACT|nr:ABC transporter permease subunit [Isobaculum melis]SER49995.1 ABC-2 type transport system permease protein [Isobaculum melis]
MMHLIKNEWRKLTLKRSFIVYLITIVALLTFVAFMTQLTNDLDTPVQNQEGEIVESESLPKNTPIYGHNQEGKPFTTVDSTIDYLNEQKENFAENEDALKQINTQLDYFEAYQKADVTPITKGNGTVSLGAFFSSIGDMSMIVNFLAVIAASIIMAAEFGDGTIKLLLTRPYKRSQILLSKYMTVILLSVLLTAFTLVATLIVGAIFFPIQSLMLPGQVSLGATPALISAFQLAGTNLLAMLTYVTISLMISSIFRSQAMAVGLGVGMIFSGSLVNMFIADMIPKYPILKWTIFNLLDINNFATNNPIAGDLSFVQVAIGLLVYIIIIYLVTNFIFKKRDVALT